MLENEVISSSQNTVDQPIAETKIIEPLISVPAPEVVLETNSVVQSETPQSIGTLEVGTPDDLMTSESGLLPVSVSESDEDKLVGLINEAYNNVSEKNLEALSALAHSN